ncbi:MAG: hypothetical protein M3P26_10790 [Gemmatimonadota bacterium]|nr:hypothetical protein [Gemmatimonadota bacterium]
MFAQYFRFAVISIAAAASALPSQAPDARAPSATKVILPAAQQIAAAVLPAPADLRATATVLGYRPDGTLATLRKGNGPLTCLASDPANAEFHVACYHRSLEAFMARGRALRSQGIKGGDVDSVRYREIRSGALRMPRAPAVLYSLTGKPGSFDPATETAKGARPLFVVYVPNATPASLGVSAVPAEGIPWVMFPGTPKAHIMFVPKM